MYYRKKMNFTTDLPKKNPLVSYIVASAMRCEKFFPTKKQQGGGLPVFRMHAVILITPGKNARNGKAQANKASAASAAPNNQKQGSGEWNPQDGGLGAQRDRELYICCHVRRVEVGTDDNDDSGGGKAASESQ